MPKLSETEDKNGAVCNRTPSALLLEFRGPISVESVFTRESKIDASVVVVGKVSARLHTAAGYKIMDMFKSRRSICVKEDIAQNNNSVPNLRYNAQLMPTVDGGRGFQTGFWVLRVPSTF